VALPNADPAGISIAGALPMTEEPSPRYRPQLLFCRGEDWFFRFLPRLITIMETLQSLTKAAEKQGEQIALLRTRLDRLSKRDF
jgi:hypothetical protein